MCDSLHTFLKSFCNFGIQFIHLKEWKKQRIKTLCQKNFPTQLNSKMKLNSLALKSLDDNDAVQVNFHVLLRESNKTRMMDPSVLFPLNFSELRHTFHFWFYLSSSEHKCKWLRKVLRYKDYLFFSACIVVR